MATPREIRRLAFEALYQLDARGEGDAPAIEAALDLPPSEADPRPEVSARDRARAMQTALGAFANRREADEEIAALAPTWPPARQPAVDRAILRLAHYEMTVGGTGAKIAVNEAVELAKAYSTERSPAFVNGVLDKVLKRVLASTGAAPDLSSPDAPQALDDAGVQPPGGGG